MGRLHQIVQRDTWKDREEVRVTINVPLRVLSILPQFISGYNSVLAVCQLYNTPAECGVAKFMEFSKLCYINMVTATYCY